MPSSQIDVRPLKKIDHLKIIFDNLCIFVIVITFVENIIDEFYYYHCINGKPNSS